MADIINTRDTLGNHEALLEVVGATLSELVDDAVYSLCSHALYGNDGIESISLPNLRRVGVEALRACTRLSTINFPALKTFSTLMCYGCTALTTVNAADVETTQNQSLSACTQLEMVNLPKLKTLGQSTFQGCTRLVDVFLNNAESIGNSAFYDCTALQEISLPKATRLDSQAFYRCTRLRTVDVPNVTTLGQNVFNGCSALTTLSLPKLSSANSYALSTIQHLTSLNIPALRTLPSYFLQGCLRLHELNLDNVATINNYALDGVPIDYLDLPNVTGTNSQIFGARGVKVADFHANVTLANSAFQNHRDLIALILRAQTLRAMGNTNVLSGTPIAAGYGWVYVPDALVDTYKTATNWSAYADRIVGISEYPKAVPGIIQDSWDEINQAELDGSYKTKYKVGDLKPLQILETVYVMQIAAFDADELADGSGMAKITWVSLGRKMNGVYMANSNGSVAWSSSYLRTWLNDNMYTDFDDDVKPYIKEVRKVSGYHSGSSYSTRTTVTSTEKVWVPSAHEIGIDSYSGISLEETGPVYSALFPTQEARAKKSGGYGTGATGAWYLRTDWSTGNYLIVRDSYSTTVDDQTTVHPAGEIGTSAQTAQYYPVFGFCT